MVAGACSDADGSDGAGGSSGAVGTGDPAPAFDLPALRGDGRVRLEDYRGSPLIVNFWASWCVPCRKEFPEFKAALERYGDEGLEIVGITYKDISSDARAFAKDQGATWTLAEGGQGDPVAKDYGVRAIPQTFFVDRDGTVVSRYFGNPSAEEFDEQIEKIL